MFSIITSYFSQMPHQLNLRDKINTWLKSHRHFYTLAKAGFYGAKSLPYIWQRFRVKISDKQLILGFSGRLKGWSSFDINPGADFLGNIKKLRLFPCNSLDKVYASHVLEHVNCHEAKLALQEMYRVLKPQGEFFIAVPDMLNVRKLLETEFAETAIDITFGVNRPVKDWQPQHKYGYTKATLEKLLRESGFTQIEEFEPFLDDTTRLAVGNIKISICLKGKKGEAVHE
jgi:predicted SAM-dependent methyltransferase